MGTQSQHVSTVDMRRYNGLFGVLAFFTRAMLVTLCGCVGERNLPPSSMSSRLAGKGRSVPQIAKV